MARRIAERNVILVVLDSARADMFTDNAPNFTGFTSTGASFSRAVAPAGWTLPSHASIFTGLSPTEHGIQALGRPGGTQENFRAAREKARRLGDHMVVPQLQRRGIRTLSSSSSPWLWHGAGLSAGFEETDFFYFLGSKPISPRKHGLPKRARQIAEAFRSVDQHLRWMRSQADKGAGHVLDTITRFVAGGGPFFAFTNLIETHEPHLPPAAYRSGGAIDRWWALRDVVLEPPLLRVLRMRAHNYGIRGMSSRTLRRWKDAYAAEIRYVDEWLVRLVERLEESKILDETAIILTSDHGEGFGEKGIVGHGVSVAEGAGHVPLGMWGAGIPRVEVTEPVGLTSIPATLRHLFFDQPEEESLLLETSRGFARMEIEDPRAVSKPPRRAKRMPTGPGAAFHDGPLKFVIDPFSGPALYDLDNDPLEVHDLLPASSPTTRQMEEAEAWERRIAGPPSDTLNTPSSPRSP